jgi:hypothetical protein
MTPDTARKCEQDAIKIDKKMLQQQNWCIVVCSDKIGVMGRTL